MLVPIILQAEKINGRRIYVPENGSEKELPAVHVKVTVLSFSESVPPVSQVPVYEIVGSLSSTILDMEEEDMVTSRKRGTSNSAFRLWRSMDHHQTLNIRM
jgi:hypothetical protein